MTSPLGVLNAFAFKDRQSRRLAKGVAFGPDARHLLDIYAPKNPRGDMPVLQFIYGGGWNSGERGEYEFAGRTFAALGFLTIIADYRLVPDIHYPDFVEDCALAANWAIENAATYGGDANRMALAGHSAGAYNAMMLALTGKKFGAPNLQKRLKAVIGLSGPYDFYPFDVDASINAFGQAKKPEQTQPVNLVTKNAPPIFLAHGDRDKTVLPRNTIALAKALRAKDNKVVERHYAGLDHAATLLMLFKFGRGWSPAYADMAAFLTSQFNG